MTKQNVSLLYTYTSELDAHLNPSTHLAPTTKQKTKQKSLPTYPNFQNQLTGIKQLLFLGLTATILLLLLLVIR